METCTFKPNLVSHSRKHSGGSRLQDTSFGSRNGNVRAGGEMLVSATPEFEELKQVSPIKKIE